MNHMIDITDNPGVKVNDLVTARNIAETLHKHYPGHLWAVTCEGEKGIATVRNMSLSGNWGFILKLKDVYADGRLKCVTGAGGEILERFRLSRGRANRDRIDELPTIVSGAPVFDPGHVKSKVPSLIVQAWNKLRH